MVDVVTLEQLEDDVQLLAGLRVARLQLEGVGRDRKVGHAPALEALVVVLGLGQLDKVPDRPGDDVGVGLEIALGLGEGARKRAGQVAADGRLLGDYECLGAHFPLDTLSERSEVT